MTFEFATALFVFLSSHAIPMLPDLRSWLIDHMGRRIYFATYGVTSIMLLLWLFSAAARTPYVPLWTPLYSAPFLGMPVVFWLIVEGLIKPNALSLGRPDPDLQNPIRHRLWPQTRHPLPVALALWAGLHILANPDLSHVILFGLLCGFSVLSMFLIDRRKQQQMGTTWETLAQGSKRFSLSGLARIRPHWIAVAIAFILYALAMISHRHFAGVPILPG